MSATAEALIARNATRPQKDRRGHLRVDLALKGRFMYGERDFPLRVHNISCGGALIRSKTQPDIDTRVVCYLDGLGRVPARVTRRGDDGFAVQFEVTAHKRDKLADQLTYLANYEKYNLDVEGLRSAPRKQASGPALVQRENGMKIQCRVVDISLTGAAFATKAAAPSLGETVQVGKLRGEVVRAMGQEFAIRFLHAART